jgi:hypothetical protein
MGRRGKTISEKKKAEVLKLSKQYGVGYLASHFGISESEIYKILRQERERPQHFSDLSLSILKLVEILDWYRQNNRMSIDPLISSSFPCDLPGFELPNLEKQELANLVAHLKTEIPEVIVIGEYPYACKKWFDLGEKQIGMKTPVVEITSELILKLKLMANRGSYSGKCPDCPT